jgi:hypothetical protein
MGNASSQDWRMMRTELYMSIANEFSPYPAGRDENDGKFNGTKFRRDFLLPRVREAISENKKLVISLEGMKSFGSSFLEEAFGGLIRKENIDKLSLRKILEVKVDWVGSERYKEAIFRYIDQAKQ